MTKNFQTGSIDPDGGRGRTGGIRASISVVPDVQSSMMAMRMHWEGIFSECVDVEWYFVDVGWLWNRVGLMMDVYIGHRVGIPTNNCDSNPSEKKRLELTNDLLYSQLGFQESFMLSGPTPDALSDHPIDCRRTASFLDFTANGQRDDCECKQHLMTRDTQSSHLRNTIQRVG